MGERTRRLDLNLEEEGYCDICGAQIPESSKFIYMDAIELYRKDIGLVHHKMFNLFHIDCWKAKSEN